MHGWAIRASAFASARVALRPRGVASRRHPYVVARRRSPAQPRPRGRLHALGRREHAMHRTGIGQRVPDDLFRIQHHERRDDQCQALEEEQRRRDVHRALVGNRRRQPVLERVQKRNDSRVGSKIRARMRTRRDLDESGDSIGGSRSFVHHTTRRCERRAKRRVSAPTDMGASMGRTSALAERESGLPCDSALDLDRSAVLAAATRLDDSVRDCLIASSDSRTCSRARGCLRPSVRGIRSGETGGRRSSRRRPGSRGCDLPRG